MELLFLSFAAILICFFCGSNNGKSTLIKNETKSANESNIKKDNPNDGIAGEWEEVHTVLDKNGNNQLGENERKNPSTKIGYYCLKFNSDGTRLFTDIKFKGTYEVEIEKGKRTLFIQDNDSRKLRILSLMGNEMVLMPTDAAGTYLI